MASGKWQGQTSRSRPVHSQPVRPGGSEDFTSPHPLKAHEISSLTAPGRTPTEFPPPRPAAQGPSPRLYTVTS